MLSPFGPAAESAAPASTTPALQRSGPTAYEATVLVMTSAPERYQARAGAGEFQAALRTRVRTQPAEPGSDPSYHVAVRPVPQAPLVVVSARAPMPELASRVAHEAAYLSIQDMERRSSAMASQASLLTGTCSPPVAVLR